MEECPSNTRYLPADFNLRNLATIAYAATLWNESNIAPFFDQSHRTRRSAKLAIDAHCAHIKNVIKETEKTLKSANIPSKISDLILCAMKMMGQRIALWSEYAQNYLNIHKEAIPTVYWTAHGTVDQGKIVQSSKVIRDDLIPPLEALYFTACSSVSIDYIKLHWKEILLFCEILTRELPNLDHFSSQVLSDRKLKFISCSVIFLAKLELSQLFPSQTQYFGKYKYSRKKNMFWLSVKEGCPEAVRHYWSLLDDQEKRESIQEAADFSLRRYRKNEKYDFFGVKPEICNENDFLNDIISDVHKSKCFADILIFFITRMTDHELTYFLTTLKEGFNRRRNILIIFEVLMCHCPLEEFLPLAFELVLTYCEAKSDYKLVISKLLDEWFRFRFLNNQIFFTKLFKGFWEKFGVDNSWGEILEKSVLEKIYKIFDLEILNFIFNDCPAEYKKRLIINGWVGFEQLFENQQFQLLKTFKDDILQSKKECNWFKEICFGFAGGFLSKRRTDLMDKLVELFYSTPEIYKNDISNQHRILQICAVLFCKSQIQAANTAFRWMFGSDEEKQNYVKNHLVKDMTWVWHIQKQKQASFHEILSKFILWLLGSLDLVDQFKSVQLASQFALKNLLAALFQLEVDSEGKRKGFEIFTVFEKFLLFCLSPENLKSLKNEIRSEIHEWILFLSGKCCLHFADDFLIWIFENRKKKDDAVCMFLKRNDATFTENTKKSNWSECNQKILSAWNETADILNESENKVENFAKKLQHRLKLEDPKYFETDCGYIYLQKTKHGWRNHPKPDLGSDDIFIFD